ncbi:MAG: hypothetical protein CM15mP49_27190 [Actinomycetota bacterium]|nr:MAG: hypothetical protein CM15mP49_27190 [Actinomycetota bacterium]
MRGVITKRRTKSRRKVLAAGLEFAKEPIKQAIALQEKLIESAGEISKMEVTLAVDYSEEIMEAVKEVGSGLLAESQTIADKTQRAEAESQAASSVLEEVLERFDEEDNAETQIKAAIRSLTKELVRKRIVEEGLRIDGRTPVDLRSFPLTLASSQQLMDQDYSSGETQVLNITTLGTKRMDQMIDGIDPITRKRYMHHYNFPPFSTGEPGFMRGPKRREIGHGALAERALLPVILGRRMAIYSQTSF